MPESKEEQSRSQTNKKNYIAGCTSASPDLTESSSNVQSRNNLNNKIKQNWMITQSIG